MVAGSEAVTAGAMPDADDRAAIAALARRAATARIAERTAPFAVSARVATTPERAVASAASVRMDRPIVRVAHARSAATGE